MKMEVQDFSVLMQTGLEIASAWDVGGEKAHKNNQALLLLLYITATDNSKDAQCTEM